MTDEQCNAIVDSINGLKLAMLQVSASIDNMCTYYDDEKLVRQVNLVAQMIEDIGVKI